MATDEHFVTKTAAARRAESVLAAAKRVFQGTAVAERDADGSGSYLIMFPNGDVERAKDKRAAEGKLRRWFARDLRRQGAEIGIGSIRWQ